MIKFHANGTLPPKGYIFVFGSNLSGVHGAGAAAAAMKMGAIWGNGKGIQGDTYAIPTKDKQIETLPLSQIKKHVMDFKEFANDNKHLNFFMTSIGTVLAGYSEEEIAPMFNPPQSNISYPDNWKNFLTSAH